MQDILQDTPQDTPQDTLQDTLQDTPQDTRQDTAFDTARIHHRKFKNLVCDKYMLPNVQVILLPILSPSHPFEEIFMFVL